MTVEAVRALHAPGTAVRHEICAAHGLGSDPVQSAQASLGCPDCHRTFITVCSYCRGGLEDWPCETIRALNGG